MPGLRAPVVVQERSPKPSTTLNFIHNGCPSSVVSTAATNGGLSGAAPAFAAVSLASETASGGTYVVVVVVARRLRDVVVIAAVVEVARIDDGSVACERGRARRERVGADGAVAGEHRPSPCSPSPALRPASSRRRKAPMPSVPGKQQVRPTIAIGGTEFGALRRALTRVAAAATLRLDAVGIFRRHGPGPARSDTMVAGRRFRHDRNGRMWRCSGACEGRCTGPFLHGCCPRQTGRRLYETGGRAMVRHGRSRESRSWAWRRVPTPASPIRGQAGREHPESRAMQGVSAGGWSRRRRVRALRPVWGPVAMR